MLCPQFLIFLSGYYQMMPKGKFFELIKVTFEKKVCKVQRIKNKCLKYQFGWKNSKSIKKRVLAPEEVNFFLVTSKRCARKISLSWWESDWESNFLKYKKNWKLTLEVSIWVKKLKVYFLNPCSRHWGQSFSWLLPKDAQSEVL